jgi:hypothetical protein
MNFLFQKDNLTRKLAEDAIKETTCLHAILLTGATRFPEQEGPREVANNRKLENQSKPKK